MSEPVYLSAVDWTTPSVNAESAEVQVKSAIMNKSGSPRDLTVIDEILDPDNQVVKSIQASAHVPPEEEYPP
jgi:hypothetical protein